MPPPINASTSLTVVFRDLHSDNRCTHALHVYSDESIEEIVGEAASAYLTAFPDPTNETSTFEAVIDGKIVADTECLIRDLVLPTLCRVSFLVVLVDRHWDDERPCCSKDSARIEWEEEMICHTHLEEQVHHGNPLTSDGNSLPRVQLVYLCPTFGEPLFVDHIIAPGETIGSVIGNNPDTFEDHFPGCDGAKLVPVLKKNVLGEEIPLKFFHRGAPHHGPGFLPIFLDMPKREGSEASQMTTGSENGSQKVVC